jgi:imidazolonepropionase-like amidohydrolase
MVRMILQPTWILNGTGSPPLRNWVVTVVGERIESVTPADQLQPQPGDQTLHLPGMTLLPGLIDCHVHLVLPGDNTPFVPWIDTQPDAALALRAAHNARTALHAGVTTVRDCGGRGTVMLNVRDALEEGLIDGARVLSCG